MITQNFDVADLQAKLAITVKALRESMGAYYSDGSGAADQYAIVRDALVEIGEMVRKDNQP